MLMRRNTRREFLAATGFGTLAVLRAAESSGRHFEGIFPILQTPFSEAGPMDLPTLVAEVKFCQRIGVQGVVWPQLASEWTTLTADERFAGAEAIVAAGKSGTAAVRPAVVIGVQAPDTEAAVRYAQHAAKIGPDAIIAIPLANTDEEKQLAYYGAIAGACKLPLFVQAIGTMSIDSILRMASEVPTLRYVKDEAGQTLQRLSDYQARHSKLISGVFPCAHGRTMID